MTTRLSDRAPMRSLKPREKCRVCGHVGWCMVATDGSAVLCMRVESSHRHARTGGWVHRLLDDPRPLRAPKAPIARPLADERPKPNLDWNSLQAELVAAVNVDQASIALQLGELGLERLGIGYSARYAGHTFPMRDAAERIIGFRVRQLGGKKFCIPGSHNGLFIPSDLGGQRLYICEGPTDCAALLDCGLAAIGRPSNTGGHELLVDWIGRRWREVVIVADRDPRGSDAERLTAGAVRKLSVDLRINGCRVVTIRPPFAKDVREWVCTGAGRSTIESAVACA